VRGALAAVGTLGLEGRASDAGVVVTGLEAGGAAARAGVALGDVVVAIDGEATPTPSVLAALVAPRAHSWSTLDLLAPPSGDGDAEAAIHRLRVRIGAEAPVTHSLRTGVPSVYLQHDFTAELLCAFDDVLAPVLLTLDGLDVYLDPMLAPEDFLPWLASWVGLAVNERWSVEQRRQFLSEAADLYRWRGTVTGISRAVEVYAGVAPEISEGGGVAWSPQPGGAVPGQRGAPLVVRVHATGGRPVDPDAIERIVADAKPAHVPHRVEVVGAGVAS
jgi:phage tail-like protein